MPPKLGPLPAPAWIGGLVFLGVLVTTLLVVLLLPESYSCDPEDGDRYFLKYIEPIRIDSTVHHHLALHFVSFFTFPVTTRTLPRRRGAYIVVQGKQLYRLERQIAHTQVWYVSQ